MLHGTAGSFKVNYVTPGLKNLPILSVSGNDIGTVWGKSGLDWMPMDIFTIKPIAHTPFGVSIGQNTDCTRLKYALSFVV
jgi:hypothetical protein